ncbi:hypothetical protein [Streptomyces sp. YIM 121038]|uniref:hypothetical protein n=1 Tax=Streptomyces sp. YIM 121038 TaxID=2136401 RepID=UPI002016C0E3|nr:hypothetical protein [Streptomyces sp. YIM 121038]
MERSLFRLPEVPPPSREALTMALGRARTSFHEAHYVELGRTLPRLISGSLAAGAHDVAARAYVLLAQLATKNYQQYAWLAADRARAQAELTSSPVLAGEAAQAMAIAMRRAGEYDASVGQLQGAASGLEGRSPDYQAMRGVLLLTASYSAAQAGRQGQAMGFLEEAEATARRMEEEHRKLPAPRDFSVDHTRLFRISVHHALGEPGPALRYARQVEPMRLPDAERRARMMMDVCRVYKDDGEPERAFAALRAMEKYAPEEVRRPKIRGIARELLVLNGEISGLRRFSQRIGA